jgi:hypothetical protein
VGVLDVDGDDLPGVGGADAQPLPGDHDDAVAGDLALDADRPGCRSRQRRVSDPGAAQPGPAVGRDRRGQGLARTPPTMTWTRCPSSRSVTRVRASSAPSLALRPARSAFPLASTARLISITVPAGSAAARAGGGIAGGGPAGAAPRIRNSARFSASRANGTVLISCPPTRTWTVTSSAQTRATCPPRTRPIFSRWTLGSTLSTPAGEITVSNSTAPPDGDRTSRGSGPVAAAGPACCRGAAAGSRSGETPGRNRLAGVAMSRAWCGRAWL